ncbi:hypothetical protein RB195_000868 [Necator americanus]|uniref:RAP domain-containing protein n=1 Tax=Necator americanus TaxID=51031 RepID=A0ABR1DBQ5_NECAM
MAFYVAVHLRRRLKRCGRASSGDRRKGQRWVVPARMSQRSQPLRYTQAPREKLRTQLHRVSGRFDPTVTSMLRRVFQSSVSFSRSVSCSASYRSITNNTVAPAEDPLKGLIDSLSSETISHVEKGSTPASKFANIQQLKVWLGKRKDHLSPPDFLGILKSALLLDKEKHSAPDFIKSCGKEPKEAEIMEMAVDDDLIAMMTALLELGLRNEPIFEILEKRLLTNLREGEFSLPLIVPFVIACNRGGYEISKELKAVLKEVLVTQIKDIDNANMLIAVLSHWDQNDKEVSRAAVAKTAELLGTDVSCCALTVGEMCSLMNKLAERSIRDKRLLPLLCARITDHRSALSVRQLVSLATSCAKLNYYDARVLRRLANDLLVDVNNFYSWADVSSLVDSFTRLRFGEMQAWNALASWVNSHVNSAPLESLSIVIAGMARNGIEECRPAASKLSQRVRRESAPSQNAWLSTVHSLAFFRVLTPELAESVLNKDFVSQLLESSKSAGERLFKATKLLQVSSCAEVDLGGSYNGPRLGFPELEPFIKFDDETTRLARMLKYGKKEIEACNHFLSDVVFKMGSPSSHISPSCIDRTGILFDARIVCEEGSSRLVAISKWGEASPRPIIFFGWGQTRQIASDDARTESNALLGWDQLSLRLLRARGVKPIVILHSDLSPLSSTAEKVQFLRRRIVDSS